MVPVFDAGIAPKDELSRGCFASEFRGFFLQVSGLRSQVSGMSHSLEGIWQPLYAELGGEEAPKMMLEKMEIELTAGNYAVRFAGLTADHGTYTIEAEGQLSLHGVAGPNAGRTIPSLFKFAGGVLSICYGLGGTRPQKFATGEDPSLYLVNYQRKEG
jgi:uncharacterized protein (TIGR03067 family)